MTQFLLVFISPGYPKLTCRSLRSGILRYMEKGIVSFRSWICHGADFLRFCPNIYCPLYYLLFAIGQDQYLWHFHIAPAVAQNMSTWCNVMNICIHTPYCVFLIFFIQKVWAIQTVALNLYFLVCSGLTYSAPMQSTGQAYSYSIPVYYIIYGILYALITTVRYCFVKKHEPIFFAAMSQYLFYIK